MPALVFALAAVATLSEVRLVADASPESVLLANPSRSPAIVGLRDLASGGALAWIPLDAGAWVGLDLPAGFDGSSIVFDHFAVDGCVAGVPLFSGTTRVRRSFVLAESEPFVLWVEAFEEEPSPDGGDGTWNPITIGPPPPGSTAVGVDEVLLFPPGSYTPKPTYRAVGGYHSPF